MTIEELKQSLRIGNLVKTTSGIYCKVGTICVYGIDFRSPLNWNHIEYPNISPIPLTEDILLKCGFERIAFTDYGISCLPGFVFQIDRSVDYVYIIARDLKINPVYYLHQLQNLIYAITGEELTVNI